MEHALSPDANRARHDSLHIRFGALGFRRRRRIRFRTRTRHRPRPIPLYPLSDSRRSRRTLAHANVLAFSHNAGTNKSPTQARALDLLEPRRRVRLQRADQRLDRARVSNWGDRPLSSSHGKLAAPAEVAPDFEHAGFSCDRRTMAHSRGSAKSTPRKRARIPLVLLRQRTHPALPQQAHASRL